MDFLKATDENICELVDLRIAFLEEDLGKLKEDASKIREILPKYYVSHLGKDLHIYIAKEGKIRSCAFLLIIEKPSSPNFLRGKTGTVLNVYTEPQFRRQGLAKRLINMMLSDAKKMALDIVELKSTKEGYNLYKSMGFVDSATKYYPMKYDV